MWDLSRLRQEDHLVHADFLELLELIADLRRRTDAILRTTLGQRERDWLGFEIVPDVGLTGLVISEKCVVPEAVQEEAVMLGRHLAHSRFVVVTQKRTGDRD